MDFQILDTTLRDGGFAVNFNFGEIDKREIEFALIKSNVDYIEVGYVDSNVKTESGKTIYGNISDIKSDSSKAVVMMDFGKVNIEDVPFADSVTIKMIRISLYKEQAEAAIDFAVQIINKGYRVSLQLMLTNEYTEQELDGVIEKINKKVPHIDAVYIVDSFGEMLPESVGKIYLKLDEKLNENIKIGLHLHNTRMMAYSNLLSIPHKKNRGIIVDSTLLGTGKGGGNISTETLIDIFNLYSKYNVSALYDIIDKVVSKKMHYSGASDQHKYIVAARLHCSPTYIKYYSEKYGLTTNQISNLIEFMDQTKRRSFDKNYAENMYHSNKYVVMMNTIKSSWDDMAHEYDTFHPCDNKSKENYKTVIKQQLETCSKVLDVGTGTGFLAEICSELGMHCTGIDISSKMLDLAQKKAALNNLKIDYRLFDGKTYPFSDNKFDAIVSSRLLWTLIKPNEVLSEWFRILKNGGKVLAFTENGAKIEDSKKRCYGSSLDYNVFYFKYCSEEEMISFFESMGFRNVVFLPFEFVNNDNGRKVGCLICNK